MATPNAASCSRSTASTRASTAKLSTSCRKHLLGRERRPQQRAPRTRLALLDWRAAHKVYAADYAECVGKHVNVPIEFDTVTHPREYNFTTDRVFGNIEHQHLHASRERHPQT